MNTSVNVNSFVAMNDSVNYVEKCNKCLELEAELIKQHNMELYAYPVNSGSKDKFIGNQLSYYLKHTIEQAAILREIVEQAKSLNPLDSASYSACKYVKLIQEFLGYVRDTYPDIHKPSEKLVAVTPINKKKTVRHELCFLEFVSDMNACSKSSRLRNAKRKKQWKPTEKITATNEVPLREPIPLEVVAQEPVVTKVYTMRPKGFQYTVALSSSSLVNLSRFTCVYIDQDAPSTSIPLTQDQEHSPIMSQGFEESPKTPHFHDDPLHESLYEDSTSQGSSSNVRPTHTPFESLGRWTKDHPIENCESGAVDPTLFTRKAGNDLLLVQIYVDDIIFASTNTALCNEFANLMTIKFKMSMMGQAKPTEKHLNAVQWMFQCLKGTIKMGLWYSKDTDQVKILHDTIGFSKRTHEEELQLLIAKDTQSSLTELKAHSCIVNTYEKFKPFINTQQLNPLHEESQSSRSSTESCKKARERCREVVMVRKSKMVTSSLLSVQLVVVAYKEVMEVLVRRPKVPKTISSNRKPKIAKSMISNKMEPGTSQGSNTSVALSSSSLVNLRLSKLFCGIHMTGDRSQLTNSVHKFLGTVKFGNDHIAKIMGTEKLYLLHMDLCGPMRVTSINRKKYILVIVDDYSQFTWVKFLASKDEAPDFIIKFLKMIQVRLNATVRNIRIDNGTEPRQSLPNPDISYLHVFGALCYPNNDSETLGKLQGKADIGIFIGYAPKKKAYRIYNRRTQKIIETIHVDFDELTAMASEQLGLGPGLQLMTPATSSSGIVSNSIPQQPCNPPQRDNWDILFQPIRFTCVYIDQDAPSTSIPLTQDQEHSPIMSQGFEESPKTPHFHDDPLHESLHEDSTSQGSSSNMRPTHTPFESLGRWTKDHPIENVIRDPSRSVSTRKQLQTDAMWCYFDAFLTSVEPKNFKQEMTESS
ncbi:retrovirus-related pol polyprotein from transposon TNT 1-94 [Tanacetum coccineum]|uniref:Retrovirus-related pol polyprotein from transposon TNT 1-94 n=1 Tax=Tanacetum coccineum TaxID=301880 RepID=A0ABQ4ZT78_9ASTR